MATHSANLRGTHNSSGLTTVLVVAPTSALLIAVTALSVWTMLEPALQLAMLAISGA